MARSPYLIVVINEFVEFVNHQARVIDSMRRACFLDLPLGFVYDCLHQAAEHLDMADHRRWVVEDFSGTQRPTRFRICR